MTNLRYRILGLAALTLALVSPAPALTQQGEAPAVQDPASQAGTVAPPEPEQPGVIATTEIQAEAEAVLATLGDIEASIAGEAEVEAFRETLRGLRAQFETLDDRYDSLDESTILTRRIDDALNSWKGLQARGITADSGWRSLRRHPGATQVARGARRAVARYLGLAG